MAQAGGASIKAIAEAAAERLANTPTVARNSYIHPAVIDLAGGEALEMETKGKAGLLASEKRLLTFLEGI